ncbi:Endoribonuclease L-PSP/chorismate mutase-like protein [Filobasidium floriforme]|uniref:Endoribonuclease L-PSP/chorismate mutase-like protein n=1 Tax=Filobasidium floriforme TaxID=5210 RepID=UPI001E8E4FCC|nr:Endoribonuclease L-PSP/chorismate mutase-like protein [Filobasidium floriforme]KAH8086792.1 Endoribonuclease L-PSP/chorismate mutase-like protein [Filobasidium floriforme]
MLFNLGLLTSLLAITSITASPLTSHAPSSSALERRNNDITHLGAVGKTLSGGTKFGDLVFVSGQVPLVNGTIVPGGIKNETALCIQRVGEILQEAGTDWSRVLKVTVLLQDINDLAEMNEVYSAMIPDPKPARAAFEVGNLPVTGISVEIEAVAAL